ITIESGPFCIADCRFRIADCEENNNLRKFEIRISKSETSTNLQSKWSILARSMAVQFEFWLFEFVLIFGIRYSDFIPPAAETKRPNRFASPTNGSGNAAGCLLTWKPSSRIF